jgi:hypothetical protein
MVGMTSHVQKLSNLMNNYKFPEFTFPTKQEQTQVWSDWFDSLRDEHELLAITIVFRPQQQNNTQARWETEYNEGVLRRFRRAIERSEARQDHALPFPDFSYFERNESSIFRVSGARKPFHIHALLPIRKSQFHRVWSIDNESLHDRLNRDIYSLGTVQSLLVEKVREGQTRDWTRYITKMKQI